MASPSKTVFRVGTWLVNPGTGEIFRDGATLHLEGRAMLLLQYLAEHAGEIVSVEELLDRVWPGVMVSSDSVYQAVALLRRQLGDDSRQPTYIATVPRLGYRLVARVTPVEESLEPSEMQSRTSSAKDLQISKIQAKWVVAAVVLVGLAIVATWSVLVRNRAGANPSASSVFASPNQRSIAVLPFLDLTDGMKEEEFADGITEELIDRLSKIPDFRVPAPTASFYYKEKKVPIADIARALGVVYVLDGSVRKSAGRFRIAARLVRAENGYVIWSETYDRPLVDKILVQEDIAGEVTKALRASIESRP
jgi:TolB-like protein/DNA-binding winged helix-turn-helix (wHTH) protein